MTAQTSGVAQAYDFFTGNKALISNAANEVAESAVSASELAHVAGATANLQSQISSKQGNLNKLTFGAYWDNGTVTAGWCKLGTFAGNASGRFEVRITGKAGWNDQNYGGLAILSGSTNYISADNGQLAAGCNWAEFATPHGPVAYQIALVRAAGYDAHRFDLLIQHDNNYVGWHVEVSWLDGSLWTTAIAWQQADPGVGSNVFKPSRSTVWDTGNFDPSTKSNTGHGHAISDITGLQASLDSKAASSHNHDVKDLSWSTTNYEDVLGHPKNGITDGSTGASGIFGSWEYRLKMLHSSNPNGWQFVLAADFFSDRIGYRRKHDGTWQAPVYLWDSSDFSASDITNWSQAYSWGNHASAGYLKANQTITLSGDASGSGTTGISVTVAKINVTEHSANNAEYPVVWDNTTRDLFHTAAKLMFNPSLGRLTATAFAGPLTGNASTATTLQTSRTFALTGVITASAVSFNGSGNVSLATAIADGALSIAKTSGLQTALDGKLNASSYTASDVLAKLLTVDGVGSGIQADSLRGNMKTVTLCTSSTPGVWKHIAVLSPSNASNFDAVILDLVQHGWTPSSGNPRRAQIVLRNRDSFVAKFWTFGDWSSSARVQAYQDAGGTVSVYLYVPATFWLIEATVRVERASFGSEVESTSPPSGTLLWDSSTATADYVSMTTQNHPDLVAIEALSGTTGLLKKTAANTWTLDTSAYLTGNQTINLTGVITGSGTTSISTSIADGALSVAKTAGLQALLDGKVSANAWNSQSIDIAPWTAAYFQDARSGDIIVRSGYVSNAVRLGVLDGAGGSNSSAIWYTKDAVGVNYALLLSTAGLRFADNAFGGGGDTAGMRLVQRSGEDQSLEIYCTNDIADWVNFAVPDQNAVKVNGYTVWNHGNFDPANYVLRSGGSGLGSMLGADAQLTRWRKDVAPVAGTNAVYNAAPIQVEREAVSGTTYAAGIGFHNRGTNAAFLYYDPASSTFRYNRQTGQIVQFWDESNLNPYQMNMGTTLEGADPFSSRSAFDGRGGVRTGDGAGPFGNLWYNMVDVRHRNTWNSPSDIWGGELVWGMTGATNRMAFRSRDANGTPSSWTEVVTSSSLATALLSYVPKNGGGLIASNDTVSFSVTNPDSGIRTILLNNGRASISIDDRVSVDDLDVGALEVDYATAHLMTFGFGNIVAANASLDSTSRVFQRVSGASNVTLTLPLPEVGKVFIVSGETSDTGAPITEAITPAFASSIRYVNTSGVCTTIGAGTLLQIKGRCIMLIGASSTQWRVVGAIQ